MTSHLDSHTTTDFEPDMLSGVQSRYEIPHDEYNVRSIAHTRSYKKDDIFDKCKALHVYGSGSQEPKGAII